MNCPNCNRTMQDKSYNYYGIGDWDMDYPATTHEEYICSHCKIKYMNGEWEIPEEIAATNKQKRAALFINRVLGVQLPVLTKKNAWQYINKYLEKAKEQRRYDFECWCEEHADWLPEYF